jgi:carbon-monoxide dehydrogenase large subunit
MDVTGVYTNKMSTDAYRGAGRPEATYAIERMMDIVADELKTDPIHLRRSNFPKPSEFPFHTACGLDYDSGDYEGALKKAKQLVGWNDLLRDRDKARRAGKLFGVGVSTYVEICAIGPSQAVTAGGWEWGCVRMEFSGKVTVITGATPHGQGQETSFAQMVADRLGIPMEDIVVLRGDTSVAQRDRVVGRQDHREGDDPRRAPARDRRQEGDVRRRKVFGRRKVRHVGRAGAAGLHRPKHPR